MVVLGWQKCVHVRNLHLTSAVCVCFQAEPKVPEAFPKACQSQSHREQLHVPVVV